MSDLDDEVEGAEDLEDVDGESDEEEEPLTDEERIDQLESQVEELQSELSQLAATCARLEGRSYEPSLEARVVGLEGVVDQLRRAIAAAAPEAWETHAAKPEPPG